MVLATCDIFFPLPVCRLRTIAHRRHPVLRLVRHVARSTMSADALLLGADVWDVYLLFPSRLIYRLHMLLKAYAAPVNHFESACRRLPWNSWHADASKKQFKWCVLARLVTLSCSSHTPATDWPSLLSAIHGHKSVRFCTNRRFCADVSTVTLKRWNCHCVW